MPQISDWLQAARLRTLPLALSSVIAGSALAALDHKLNFVTMLLAISTTLFLQVLSNYANDFGDSISGVDSALRLKQGPKRAVAAGTISAAQMKNAIIITSTLAFVSGCVLLIYTLGQNLQTLLLFVGIGIASIAAAILYTNGKRPYGYAGFGDIAVLIFFGFVGVCGTYYLMAGSVTYLNLLPAMAFGFLATGVLNINNLRDIDSDRATGKNSIPVRLGLNGGKAYHIMLLVLSFTSLILYIIIQEKVWLNLILLSTPLILINCIKTMRSNTASDFNPLLKQLSLTSFFIAVCFIAGAIIESTY